MRRGRRTARLAALLAGGALLGCQQAADTARGGLNMVADTARSGYDHAKAMVTGKEEAAKVPPGQRFIDQAAGKARTAVAADRQAKAQGLLGDKFDDITGVVQAARFTAYMRGLVDRVLARYDHAQPVRNIFIDASDVPEASSTPDGDIWITLGLIESVSTESELAAALAHEAGHIELDHFGSTEYFTKQRQAVTAGAAAGLMAISLRHTKVNSVGQNISVATTDPQSVQSQSLTLVASTWVLNKVSDGVVANWWQRGQEEQADLVSADLTAAAGFDADGIKSMLSDIAIKLKQRIELAKAIEQQRDELTAELAKTDPLVAFQQLPQFVIGHATAFGKNVGGDVWDSLTADHPRPQDRQRWIGPYIEARYDDQTYTPKQSEADVQRLSDAMAAGLPERIREGHHEANAAAEQLGRGEVAEATASIDKALRSAARDSAHVRLVAYMVSKRQGRDEEAFRHLKAIAADELKPQDVFVFLSTEYALRRRWDDARAALDAGAAQFGDEQRFLPAYINLAVAQQDEAAARETHDKCRAASSDAIKLSCDQAIEPLHLADLQPATSPSLMQRLQKSIPALGLVGGV